MDGWITSKKKVEPIFNEFGDDVSESYEFCEFIPCKYYASTRNDLANIGGGTFKQATYVITTKNLNVEGKVFRLYDREKKLVCEKDCMRLEKLMSIRRTKILL